jgi:hypothetical protein
MKSNRMILAGVAILLAPISPHTGAQTPATKSQDLRNILTQALDQPTDLVVKDQTLEAAFSQISDQTGIRVEIAPAAVDLLPYGRDTRVSVTVKGYPLRQGLRQLITPIGMTFEILDDKVLVRATPVLTRIGRRATWEELTLIDQLSNKPFDSAMSSLSIQYQVATTNNPQAELLAKAKNAGRGSATEVLDIATRTLGWTWYPWDRQIVVLTLEQQAMRMLDKRYTFRYRQRNLGEILVELSNWAGLPIELAPGTLDKLPSQTRDSFSLVAENYSIRQALELICGNTGLEYRIKDGAISLAAGASLQGGQPSGFSQSDPYVGKIVIPGKNGGYNFEFFLRESDLPPDLNRLRKEKIKNAVDTMRKELAP